MNSFFLGSVSLHSLVVAGPHRFWTASVGVWVFICGCIRVCGLYDFMCLSLHQNFVGNGEGREQGGQKEKEESGKTWAARGRAKPKKVQLKLHMHNI